jgi:hypothetical protein
MKKLIFLLSILLSVSLNSQTLLKNEESNALLFVKNDKRSQKFENYVWAKHGSAFDFNYFKENNKIEYLKELWYYSQSFYVKRNHFQSGETMDETMIDISRFDSTRKEDSEEIITISGFKDVIVLLPKNKLLFTND